ncbi:uncharacterized protein PAC_12708 [Phialocephala subalpina]|uniref:Uncharacterized protein n=1 Tax=Phialocephala subalpina TaxID=576137 RepID=A0A1L7XCQ2_9HELO|nr:uncharacterized protein PAC_12708 [Phialocephala subalpina]
MAAARSPTSPSITFQEPALVRVPTGSSGLTPEEEDEKNHAQDWTQTTDPKDSWANRERRRSSVWSKIDDVDVTSYNAKRLSATGAPRRGSILSVWSAGKDKKGRDVLAHDDHEGSDEDESAIAREDSEKAESINGDPALLADMQRRERRGTGGSGSDRRGSILSLWSQGKDEKGRPIMFHDDEEWKV